MCSLEESVVRILKNCLQHILDMLKTKLPNNPGKAVT